MDFQPRNWCIARCIVVAPLGENSSCTLTRTPSDFTLAACPLAQEKRKRAWLQGTLAIEHDDGGGSGAGGVADQWTTQKAAHSAPVEAHYITKYAAFLPVLLAACRRPTDTTLCSVSVIVGLRYPPRSG